MNYQIGTKEMIKMTEGIKVWYRDLNWPLWIKGLISAALSGLATGITLIIVDPVTFNIQTSGGLEKLGTVSFISAIVSVANYLKQSPLPPEKSEDKKEE